MTTQESLRVAVVADQAVLRRGLAAMVMAIQGVGLVGEARGLEEALQLCEMTHPGLVLLDMKGSMANAKGAAAELQRRYPSLEVVVVVSTTDEQRLQEMPDEEMPCYFSRDISEEEFAEALQQIGLGHTGFLTPGSRTGGLPTALTESVLAMETDETSGERGSAALFQELAMAGKIQAGILPEKAPTLPGWEVAARLVAARETSGDFYDFIPVSDKNWGFVIADVADKGMGAALIMTLSNTLLRSFAPRYPTLPALTLDAVNTRVLSDTRGSLFITAFYGVLEPHIGRLRYVNAGHPPPLLVKSQKSKPVDYLSKTGMALGILENYHWKQKIVILAPGDVLVLYTDGVIEAQNAQGVFFDRHRLQEVVRAHAHRTASVIIDAVLTEVHRFTAGAPGQDDIGLVVIRRKK